MLLLMIQLPALTNETSCAQLLVQRLPVSYRYHFSRLNVEVCMRRGFWSLGVTDSPWTQ